MKSNAAIVFHLLCLFFAVLLSSGLASADAGPGDLSALERVLLDRINAARANPLGVAAALGKNPDQVLADLPALAEVLKRGMPLFTDQPELVESATAHTGDMLARNFYNKISPEGASPADRMTASGYVAQKTGETIAVIAFKNFIEPEQAVSLLFQNIYLDELNPSFSSPRNILGPELKDIGIAIDTGKLTLAGTVYNVYVVTCDFGAPVVLQPDITRAEFYFMDLVNRARQDPVSTASRFGIDAAWVALRLAQHFPDGFHAIDPLVFCDALADYARADTQARIQQIDPATLSGNVTLAPVSPLDRYFCATDVNGIAGYLENVDDMSPFAAVEAIFKAALIAELSEPAGTPGILLNPAIRHMGTYLTHMTITSGGWVSRIYAMTGGFGGPSLITAAEKEAMAMINQARVNPALAAERLGMTLEAFPVEGKNDPVQYPPLIPSYRIYTASADHAADMAAQNYYDVYSKDAAEDLGDRLWRNGYDYSGFTEKLGLFGSRWPFDPLPVGESLLDRMIAKDLRDFPQGRHVLHPDMTHMGFRSQHTQPEPVPPGDGQPPVKRGYFQSNHVVLTVLDLAASAGDRSLAMLGLVFVDKNQNGRYDRGEGLPMWPVTIDDGSFQVHLFTDGTGQFFVPMPAGNYQVTAAYSDQVQTAALVLQDGAVLATLPFQLTE